MPSNDNILRIGDYLENAESEQIRLIREYNHYRAEEDHRKQRKLNRIIAAIDAAVTLAIGAGFIFCIILTISML